MRVTVLKTVDLILSSILESSQIFSVFHSFLGCIGMMVGHPLDTVKVSKQNKTINISLEIDFINYH